jgi:hypothetical protein
LVFLVVLTVAVLAVAQAAHAHGNDHGVHSNQSDNRGSVKVDDDDIDDGPANHPHVICGLLFVVEHGVGTPFDIDFIALAPTTRAGDDQRVLIVHVPGGDNVRGLIDLRGVLGGIVPHPQQGFHISITVHLPGGDKHKVIWVQLCPPEQQSATTTTTVHGGTTTTTAKGGTTTTTVKAATTTTLVGGAVTNTSVPTQVLGENFVKPATDAAGATSLANTGSPFSPALAVGLVFAGMVVLGAARHASGRRLELSMRRVDERER